MKERERERDRQTDSDREITYKTLIRMCNVLVVQVAIHHKQETNDEYIAVLKYWKRCPKLYSQLVVVYIALRFVVT